ncbi:MAG: hypothetical protein OXE41_09800 [Gammaproteobacteria bacterium]|nr:hypothetical protein [Gammaproteobacteria bacterium]
MFALELVGLVRELICTRYNNGHNWLDPEKLYNPHLILYLFNKREFREYWFHSNEPSYLYWLLDDNQVSPILANNRVVNAFFVANLRWVSTIQNSNCYMIMEH